MNLSELNVFIVHKGNCFYIREAEIQIQSQLATIEDGELVEVNVDIASIENRIAERKKQDAFRLPSTTAVRNARRLMTYQAEQKVAEEMFNKECAIIPDSTGQKEEPHQCGCPSHQGEGEFQV